jgi:hypothetical protein
LKENFQIRYLLINRHERMPQRRGDRLDALCPFLLSSNAGDPGLGHQIAIHPMTMGSNHLITRVQIPVAALILEKVENREELIQS